MNIMIFYLVVLEHASIFISQRLMVYLAYEELIKNKTERDDSGFDRFMSIMEKKIRLVPNEEIEPFIDEAIKISPDPKDIHYFALALKLNIPIWSNDKKLKTQDRVKVYSTEEIKSILKK